MRWEENKKGPTQTKECSYLEEHDIVVNLVDSKNTEGSELQWNTIFLPSWGNRCI